MAKFDVDELPVFKQFQKLSTLIDEFTLCKVLEKVDKPLSRKRKRNVFSYSSQVKKADKIWRKIVDTSQNKNVRYNISKVLYLCPISSNSTEWHDLDSITKTMKILLRDLTRAKDDGKTLDFNLINVVSSIQGQWNKLTSKISHDTETSTDIVPELLVIKDTNEMSHLENSIPEEFF